MIILSIRRTIAFSVILAGLGSCSNDIEVMAPYKAIPVVYCILNQNDSTHYVRLEKSFMGAADAYEMARETDSIYYPEASVFLERWADGQRKEQLVMERNIYPVRDSGIFSNNPNYVYSSTTKLKSNSEYRLNILVPSINTAISAVTHTVSEFKIIRPEAYKKNLAFSSYDNYQTLEWISAPYTRIYHLVIRFHYLEVTHQDTVNKTADWNIGDYISQFGSGGEVMTADILQRNFYKWLGNKLVKPAADVQRLANKKAIDFIFTVGGEELFTYMEVYKADNGILKEKPVFTNIVNGIGLFSSRYEQSVAGKSLSDHSIDSIAYGMYTKNLQFADSQNDYYYN
ncbi:MAG: DUF4249 family protein [Bacteroidales bacterium]|jgi:hypothetical protein